MLLRYLQKGVQPILKRSIFSNQLITFYARRNYFQSSKSLSLYDILGVPNGATKETIKSAYYKLAKTCHPDVGGDSKKFIEIENAYRTLTDGVIINKVFNSFSENFQNLFVEINQFNVLDYLMHLANKIKFVYSLQLFMTLEKCKKLNISFHNDIIRGINDDKLRDVKSEYLLQSILTLGWHGLISQQNIDTIAKLSKDNHCLIVDAAYVCGNLFNQVIFDLLCKSANSDDRDIVFISTTLRLLHSENKQSIFNRAHVKNILPLLLDKLKEDNQKRLVFYSLPTALITNNNLELVLSLNLQDTVYLNNIFSMLSCMMTRCEFEKIVDQARFDKLINCNLQMLHTSLNSILDKQKSIDEFLRLGNCQH